MSTIEQLQDGTTDTVPEVERAADPAPEVEAEDQEAPEVEVEDQPEGKADDKDPRLSALSQEARKYRKRLAEAVGEVETLTAAKRNLEIQILQARTEKRLQRSDDLARFVKIDDLRDEDGNLTNENIDAAVDALLEARPYLKAPESPRAPKGKPKMMKGTPVGRRRLPEPQTVPSLSQKLGANLSDVGWHELLDPQGEYAQSRPGHVTRYSGTIKTDGN